MYKDIIGKRYGKEGQVEVIELLKERQKLKKAYKIKCHTCAKDPELYGDGIFNTTGALIAQQTTSCACSTRFEHTPDQTKVQVERLCIKLNYKFLGFVGDWDGVQTKMSLKCGTCAYEWSSCTVMRLKRGHGCPQCADNARKNSDEEHIAGFFSTGKFYEGTKFWRKPAANKKEQRERKWKYTCPVCSDDEFVKEGLCTGIFESYGHSLAAGAKSCRCSIVYKMTQAQKEYHINKVISDNLLNVKFVRWAETYFGASTMVTLRCKEHGEWTVRASSFTDQGNRCPDCAEFGFKGNSPGWLYVLYNGELTKIGITNGPVEVRVRQLNSKGKGFSIIGQQLFNLGAHASALETTLLKELRKQYLQPPNKFEGSSECFLGLDPHELASDILARLPKYTEETYDYYRPLDRPWASPLTGK